MTKQRRIEELEKQILDMELSFAVLTVEMQKQTDLMKQLGMRMQIAREGREPEAPEEEATS